MKLSITRFKKDDTALWNKFLSTARNELFIFNRAYMDYHEDRFADHSLMILRDEKLFAVFPANAKDKKIYSHAGLTFGGLISSNELRANEAVEVLDLIIQYCSNLGFEEIYYKVIPYIFYKYPCQEDLYALFRHNAVLYRRDISSVIDLTDPIRFSETKRQAINKCRQANVEVSENKNFSEYWDLLKSVLSKFDVLPVHTLSEISYLKQNFSDTIRLFEARLAGELLAGIVIYDYGKTIHTQYMANSEKGRSMGTLDFINAQLITGEFKNRKYYSFGISTEQEGKVLNEGLIKQKEMMGGRAIVNDFYKISIK